MAGARPGGPDLPGENRSAVTPQARKRRRMMVACNSCRSKKMRCDGQRPTCSSCECKRVVCCYDDDAVSLPTTNSLANLEARVARLENQQPDRGSCLETVQTYHLTSGHSSKNTEPHDGPFYLDPLAREQSPEQAPYTSSSTRRFMRDITHITDPISHLAAPSRSFITAGVHDNIETDQMAMVLPDRSFADDLLMSYYYNIQPVFPFIHIPSFCAKYHSLWQPGGACFTSLAEKATFYATMNITLALGCFTSSQVEKSRKVQVADHFYQRARLLVPLDAIDVPSLEIVQFLLLTSYYLYSTKYANRCWNTLGLAIRVARTIGIHCDASLPKPASQLNIEMRRRTWHLCVLIESITSATFGRSSLLSNQWNVALPSAIDDDYLKEDEKTEGTQPPGVPSMLCCFIYCTKIFQTLRDATTDRVQEGGAISTKPHGSSVQELQKLTQILHLNSKLDHIQESLPDHLKPGSTTSIYLVGSQLNIIKFQSDIIAASIHSVRLIILRRSLLESARMAICPTMTAMSRSEQVLCNEIGQICVDSAVQAIELFYRSLKERRQMLSSLTVVVSIAAITVITATVLCPQFELGKGQAPEYREDLISMGAEILEEHKWYVSAAQGASESLERFRKIVDSASNRKQSAYELGDRSDNLAATYAEAYESFDFINSFDLLQWDTLIPTLSLPSTNMDNFN